MKFKKTEINKLLGILIFAFCVFFSLTSLSFVETAHANTYIPMEQIPGQESVPTDFYTYISYVYRFGIGAVGIAALLMLIIGGFMYITSAGNNASMEKAKGVITDAIVGVILALTAYLLLYTINPELVQIKKLPAVQAPVAGTIVLPAAAPVIAVPSAFVCTGGGCGQVDTAIQSNSYGINPNILKSLLAGGEGCNPKLSTDGKGSCGYSQALPDIRTACGISGSASQSCAQIQSDAQLDINCAAWLIKQQSSTCTSTDLGKVACCYNGGPTNSNCQKGNTAYRTKVTNFYNTYCNK